MRSLILAAALVLATVPANAGTVQLIPSRDNTLFDTPTGDLSNGIGRHMFAGANAGLAIRRALMFFDVATLVSGDAIVDSVRLQLHMSRPAPGAGPSPVSLHRALASWGEGTSEADNESGGSGAAATAGDATWLHRFYDTTFWSTAGGDFAPTPSATITVSNDTTVAWTWGSTASLVADVQGWISTPATNFGWFLLGEETVASSARRFETREQPVAAYRPQLTVVFHRPADVPPGIARGVRLSPPSPNPSVRGAQLAFELPVATDVRLEAFDVRGRRVATLAAGEQTAGMHTLAWSGRGDEGASLPSGLYFVRLHALGTEATQRLIWMP